jgi:hypothetical protein
MPDRTVISGQSRFACEHATSVLACKLSTSPAFWIWFWPAYTLPQTPDQQTRHAVTRRITAHVTARWPRLGEPLVRHRGQYCYVARSCPAAPTPPRSCARATRAPPTTGPSRSTRQHRPVHRIRTARLVRAGNRQARTRDRRHLHPLRRPRNRKLTALAGAPGKSAKVECLSTVAFYGGVARKKAGSTDESGRS